jgi:phosphoribosylamine--glycine ligase
LAAGKGVIICEPVDEACSAAAAMLKDGAFGAAGDTILVEEFMEGEELSLFVMTDGERLAVLPAAQDHKRLLDHDRGPNTGGMGAYTPLSLVEETPGVVDEILDRVVRPTLAAMRARGTPFTGLLYVGAMLTTDGPKVVEFNCRFGDPETQAVLPAMSRSESMVEAMFTIARGDKLSGDSLLAASRSAVTTVLAAPGYPEAPRTGAVIRMPAVPSNVLVFHSGTKRRSDGSLVTAGGRVLAVTGLGSAFDEAQLRSQSFAREIEFEGRQFRADIGWRELDRRAGAT